MSILHHAFRVAIDRPGRIKSGIDRSRVKKIKIAALALVVAGILTAAYAFLVEPYWIEVTNHRVGAPVSRPLKIAHLTDLHTDGLGRRERKMLALIEAERPDIIAVTGDTIANHGTLEMCRNVLASLRAPLGVWLVRGNWEIWKPAKNERSIYEAAGINFLLNDGQEVTPGVWIVGFDDSYAGSPNLTAAFSKVPQGAFIIALFHSPGYFDRVSGKCNLALAGHMHGGQVRLPFIGPLWLPARDSRFLAGWYDQEGSRMYVSRGIGTSIMNVRFYCRPELAFITLEPAKDSRE